MSPRRATWSRQGRPLWPRRTAHRAEPSTDYLSGKDPADHAVNAQAAMESYTGAFGWSAAFFAVGVVVSFLLSRCGVPKGDENAAPWSDQPLPTGGW
jgi:hypothetical protein